MRPLKQRTMTKPQFDTILTCLTWRYSSFSELIGRKIENPVDETICTPARIQSFILPVLIRIDKISSFEVR